jgi:hypothetical protein
MGLLPSIASTLSFSIPAGPVGMVWGWFLASMFIFVVGMAMADLGKPYSIGLLFLRVGSQNQGVISRAVSSYAGSRNSSQALNSYRCITILLY